MLLHAWACSYIFEQKSISATAAMYVDYKTIACQESIQVMGCFNLYEQMTNAVIFWWGHKTSLYELSLMFSPIPVLLLVYTQKKICK